MLSIFKYRLVWVDHGIKQFFEIDGPREAHFYEVKIQSRWAESWEDIDSNSLVGPVDNTVYPTIAEMQAAEDRLLDRLQLSREDLEAPGAIES